MNFFARFNPLRALRDLRLFLHQRRPHELGFFALSVVVTTLILVGFVKDSQVERVYRPDIIYVEQWRLDRSDEEIRAQQAIDGPIKERRLAEEKKRQEELQASFRRLDEKMQRWGL